MATITSLTALPEPGGVLSGPNLTQMLANITTANTNTTNINTQLATIAAFTLGVTQQGGTVKGLHFYAGGAPPLTTTTGTDTAGINGTLFISEVIVPANGTFTGVSFLLGSVGGTDKVVVALFDSAGAILANSALDSSRTAGTTATF